MPLDAAGSRVQRAVQLAAVAAVAGMVVALLPRPADAASRNDFVVFKAEALGEQVRVAPENPDLLIAPPQPGVSVALAEMNISQNHAIASPVFPGNVVIGLPGLLALIDAPVSAGYPAHAQTFYPPGEESHGEVEAIGEEDSFLVRGATNRAFTDATTAEAETTFAGASAGEGAISLSGGRSEAATMLEDAGTVAEATSHADEVVIADALELRGLTARAETRSDGSPAGRVAVAECRLGDVPCALTPDGVEIAEEELTPLEEVEAQQALAELEAEQISVRLGDVAMGEDGAVDAAAVVVTTVTGVPTHPGLPAEELVVHYRIVRASASALAQPRENTPGSEGPTALVGGSSVGGAGDEEAPAATTSSDDGGRARASAPSARADSGGTSAPRMEESAETGAAAPATAGEERADAPAAPQQEQSAAAPEAPTQVAHRVANMSSAVPLWIGLLVSAGGVLAALTAGLVRRLAGATG